MSAVLPKAVGQVLGDRDRAMPFLSLILFIPLTSLYLLFISSPSPLKGFQFCCKCPTEDMQTGPTFLLSLAVVLPHLAAFHFASK